MSASRRVQPYTRECGMVFFMVLIGIVVMSIAGIALMRASYTGSVVAGNFAFKQASVAAGDTAVEAAFTKLATILAGFAEAAYPVGCRGGACIYYPTRQATDVNGIPTIVGDWSAVPSNTVNTSYEAKYVIDRMCVGALPIANPAISCYIGQAPTAGGSHKVGDTTFASAPQTYYRVSVQVTGPRNTVSLLQAIVSK